MYREGCAARRTYGENILMHHGACMVNTISAVAGGKSNSRVTASDLLNREPVVPSPYSSAVRASSGAKKPVKPAKKKNVAPVTVSSYEEFLKVMEKSKPAAKVVDI